MICQKCHKAEYEATITPFKIECQNRLFSFDNVPALKCPGCGHIFIPESSMRPIIVHTQKINQCPGIAYHRVKWSPELEEDAREADKKSGPGSILETQKKALRYIEKNKKRVQDQKLTKKNVLKLFKWSYDQETGIKKDQVVNEIIAHIKDNDQGVFTFSCKSSPSSPYESFEYALLVTEERAWFYCLHDATCPIFHFV